MALRHGLRQYKGVSSLKIEVSADQGRQARHVFRIDCVADARQLFESRCHVEGIPQHDGIDDQPQCSELVLLAFAVTLPEFAALAMKNRTCKAVAVFAAVELRQNAPSIVLIIDAGQHVKGFRDTSQGRARARASVVGRLLLSSDRMSSEALTVP